MHSQTVAGRNYSRGGFAKDSGMVTPVELGRPSFVPTEKRSHERPRAVTAAERATPEPQVAGRVRAAQIQAIFRFTPLAMAVNVANVGMIALALHEKANPYST